MLIKIFLKKRWPSPLHNHLMGPCWCPLLSEKGWGGPWGDGVLFSLLFLLFRATTAAYGGSQARGPIRAAAAGLSHSHSNTRCSYVCDLYHSSQQHWILNPLSEAREQTCNLMVPSRIRFHWAIIGPPEYWLYWFNNCDNYTIPMQDVNNKGICVWDIYALIAVFI